MHMEIILCCGLKGYPIFLSGLLFGMLIRICFADSHLQECVLLMIPLSADILNIIYCHDKNISVFIRIWNLLLYIAFRLISLVVMVPYLLNLSDELKDKSFYGIIYHITNFYLIFTNLCCLLPYVVYSFRKLRNEHANLPMLQQRRVVVTNPLPLPDTYIQ